MAVQWPKEAPMPEPSFFFDTLSAGREGARLRYGLSGPLGFAAHGFALAAITVMSSFSVPEHLTPNAPSTTFLQFAPPPPPALRRGVSLEQSSRAAPRPVDPDARTFVPTPTFVIPVEMLTATLPMSDIPIGVENGFDDGDINGIGGRMPGGVVGGVPGGLVGGVIGGTGTELPDICRTEASPYAPGELHRRSDPAKRQRLREIACRDRRARESPRPRDTPLHSRARRRGNPHRGIELALRASDEERPPHPLPERPSRQV